MVYIVKCRCDIDQRIHCWSLNTYDFGYRSRRYKTISISSDRHPWSNLFGAPIVLIMSLDCNCLIDWRIFGGKTIETKELRMSLLLASFYTIAVPCQHFQWYCCPCGRAFRIEQEIATLVFNPSRIESNPRGKCYSEDAFFLSLHPSYCLLW